MWWLILNVAMPIPNGHGEKSSAIAFCTTTIPHKDLCPYTNIVDIFSESI